MYLDHNLTHLNIRSGQVPILRILKSKEGLSQNVLCGYLHVDRGTIAKTIKPLIREGYIKRIINPDDRRAYKIYLTGKGKSVLRELNAIIDSWLYEIAGGLTDFEKEMLQNILSRVSGNAFGFFDKGND